MSDEFDAYFATTFQSLLEGVDEHWSWDRKAAWLLYNASMKGLYDMAGTKRTSRKAPANEIAGKLQEALKFVSVAKGATHVLFQGGWTVATNGVITAATYTEGLDLGGYVDLPLLTDALAHVGKDLEITVEDTGLYIVSGDYRAVIPTADLSKTTIPQPNPPMGQFPPNFQNAMERCSRIISDSATSLRDAVMWLRPVPGQSYSQSFVSTIGAVLIEADLGGYMPPSLLFPKAFYTALSKIEVMPSKWGYSGQSFTAHYENGSTITTNLYDAVNYPADKVEPMIERLMTMPTAIPPPKGFFAAVEAVTPFANDGTVFFLGGQVRAAPNDEREEWACVVNVDKLPDGVATTGKFVSLFADAEKLYLGSDDDELHRVVILGPGYRAAIGGSRAIPARPVEAPPATPTQAPKWGPVGATPNGSPAPQSSGPSTLPQVAWNAPVGAGETSPGSAGPSPSNPTTSPPAWAGGGVPSAASAQPPNPSLNPDGTIGTPGLTPAPNAAPAPTNTGNAGYPFNQGGPPAFSFTATPPGEWSDVDNGEDQ